MIRSIGSLKLLLALSLIVASVCATSRAAEPFTPPAEGSKIDVREGDSWTTVTFIRKEGRKLLIRYDDGTEEWIFPDRLRWAGAQLGGNSSTSQPFTTNTGARPVAPPAPEYRADSSPPLDINGAVTALDLDHAADPNPLPKGTSFSIPTTQPSADFSACPVVRRNTDFGNSIDRLVSCAGNPSVVVITCGTVFATAPEVICIDLNTKQTLPIHGSTTKGQQVISAAEDGKVLLSIIGMGWEPKIHLWNYQGQGYQLRANYDPFSDLAGHGRGLAMARLIDPTHAIFSANSGETYLVDLTANKAIGFVKGAPNAKPYVDPTGQVLGVLTERATALLIRTSDFSTIIEIPNTDTRGNVCIDRAGTLLAYPTGDSDVHIAKISDGTETGVLHAIAKSDSHIELLDGGLVLVDQKDVYDIKSGLPVWTYNRPFGVMDSPKMLADGRMAVLTNFAGTSSACAVQLPDTAAKNAAATISKDKFFLAPGTPVYITGDLEAFGDAQAHAKQVITDKLEAAKLTVAADAGAAIHAVVKVVAGPIEQRVFRMQGDQKLKVVDCPSTVVTISLENKSQSVWSQSFTFKAGTPVQLKEGQSIKEAVAEAALPDIDKMLGLSFPTYLAKGTNGLTNVGLGASDITAHGLEPSKRSTSAPQLRRSFPRGMPPGPPPAPQNPPSSPPHDTTPAAQPGERA